jgi:hypothetical protein
MAQVSRWSEGFLDRGVSVGFEPTRRVVMNAAFFEATLFELLHREPFQPFVVAMTDGRLIEIKRPGLAVGGGGASFLTPECDLVEFNCEDVQEIRGTMHGG